MRKMERQVPVPVSYTHLDVYKRQVEQRRRRFRWCDLSESWTIDVGGAVGKSRLCELRVIDDVKEIQAQFQADAFCPSCLRGFEAPLAQCPEACLRPFCSHPG